MSYFIYITSILYTLLLMICLALILYCYIGYSISYRKEMSLMEKEFKLKGGTGKGIKSMRKQRTKTNYLLFLLLICLPLTPIIFLLYFLKKEIK